MMIAIPDYDDVMQDRAKERRYVGRGTGRRIAAWRIGPDWYAREEIMIAGRWIAASRAANGDTWVQTVEAVMRRSR